MDKDRIVESAKVVKGKLKAGSRMNPSSYS
jgi:hypothetical protein